MLIHVIEKFRVGLAGSCERKWRHSSMESLRLDLLAGDYVFRFIFPTWRIQANSVLHPGPERSSGLPASLALTI